MLILTLSTCQARLIFFMFLCTMPRTALHTLLLSKKGGTAYKAIALKTMQSCTIPSYLYSEFMSFINI